MTAYPLRNGRDGGDGRAALPDSAEAQTFQQEIRAVGRKLWQRMSVDGHGGNNSYRLREDAVLGTPAPCSNADLTPADPRLVDLDGKQLAGGTARTSGILLRLEMDKAVPDARLCGDSCLACDMPERPGTITTLPNGGGAGRAPGVTEAMLKALEEKKRG